MSQPVRASEIEVDEGRWSPAGSDARCEIEHDDGCITCGDVAVELEVVELDRDRGLALCRDQEDRRETVETALVEPVSVGDRLLVHAAAAIAKAAPAGPRIPGREAEDPGPPPSGTPGREAEEVAGQ